MLSRLKLPVLGVFILCSSGMYGQSVDKTITTNSDGDYVITIDENTTGDLFTVTANDPDGTATNPQTLSISTTTTNTNLGGGTLNSPPSFIDNNLTMDPISGAVSIATAFDYESIGANNQTDGIPFTLTVSDGALSTTKNVILMINNVFDNLYMTSPSSIAINEGTYSSATNVGSIFFIVGSDPGSSYSFSPSNPPLATSIAVNTHSNLFQVSTQAGQIHTLQIKPNTSFDFETENEYVVELEVTQYGNTQVFTRTVTVNNVNEAPVIISIQ